MRIKIRLAIVIALILCTSFSANAAAGYIISSGRIQHRVFEDSREYNQLYLEVKDELGDYISDGNIVTNVRLFDPNNDLVDMTPITFQPPYEITLGRFNLESGQWEFDPAFVVSAFTAEINDPLIIGTYSVEVTTEEGQLPVKECNFNQQIDNFPYVSFRSFQIHHDSLGNVHFNWDIGEKIITLAGGYQTTFKAWVKACYDQDRTNCFSNLWINVPTHMGTLYIPNTLVQQLQNSGNTFVFTVVFETSPNNYRSFSSGITVSDLLSTVYRKKQVAVVPMF